MGEFSRRRWDRVDANVNLFNTCIARQRQKPSLTARTLNHFVTGTTSSVLHFSKHRLTVMFVSMSNDSYTYTIYTTNVHPKNNESIFATFSCLISKWTVVYFMKIGKLQWLHELNECRQFLMAKFAWMQHIQCSTSPENIDSKATHSVSDHVHENFSLILQEVTIWEQQGVGLNCAHQTRSIINCCCDTNGRLLGMLYECVAMCFINNEIQKYRIGKVDDIVEGVVIWQNEAMQNGKTFVETVMTELLAMQTCETPARAWWAFFWSPQLPVANEYFNPFVIISCLIDASRLKSLPLSIARCAYRRISFVRLRKSLKQ